MSEHTVCVVVAHDKVFRTGGEQHDPNLRPILIGSSSLAILSAMAPHCPTMLLFVGSTLL